MANFRLRYAVDQWFRDIDSAYPLKFELYYLCVLAGLAHGRKREVPRDQARDIIDHYPEDFQGRGKLLVGLLLRGELRQQGINLDEREAVRKEIRKLVGHASKSYLSDYGMDLMNCYADGGFDVLTECFGDRPRSVETFVRLYRRCVQAGDSLTPAA